VHGKDLKSAKTKTPDYLFTEMASCEAGSTLGKEEDLAIISGVLDGVKQSFVDEGVDPVILEQLQQLWY